MVSSDVVVGPSDTFDPAGAPMDDADAEEISRKRCSTPISSASSASIEVGIWVNVRCVAVPS